MKPEETVQRRAPEVLADALRKFLDRDAHANISKLLGRVRPEDVALVLSDLPLERQLKVFEILTADYPDAAGEVLTGLEAAQRLALLESLPPEQTAAILARIPVDDAVFVVESLPRDLHDRVLELVDVKELADVQTQLGYRAGSAGRLMDTEFFALAENETVRAAIAALQEKRDVEMVFYLYVVDRDAHLVGVTSLRQLLLSKPDQTLGEIMQRSVIKVNVTTDQEEVAGLAARYDLLAIPVVDDANHLAGIVTVDDIIDVVREEAAEDLMKMAGSSESELLYPERVWQVARHRLPAVLVSLVGLVVTGLLLESFQVKLTEALFLLAFVPLIMGMGGSIGGQASTVAVRGVASGELGSGSGRFFEFLGQQARVAALLGLACALVAGAVAAVLERNPYYGLVVGVALFLAMVFAAVSGSTMPLLFRKLGVDPAVASGPLLATINDITGILIYFGLALALVRHLVG